MRHLIVFDCETGGLDWKVNPITQFACVVLNGETLQEIDSYSAYIEPYMPESAYEPVALNYTNITLDMLREKGKPVATVANEIADLFIKHKTGKGKSANNSKYFPVLVGHNASSFDRYFIHKLFRDNGMDLYKFVQVHFEDTISLYQNVYPTANTVKLGACCEALGIELTSAHDAMADVRATAKVFQTLVMRMRSDGGEVSTDSSSKYVRDYSFKF